MCDSCTLLRASLASAEADLRLSQNAGRHYRRDAEQAWSVVNADVPKQIADALADLDSVHAAHTAEVATLKKAHALARQRDRDRAKAAEARMTALALQVDALRQELNELKEIIG